VLVPQIVRARHHEDGGELYINRIITWGFLLFIAVTLIATLAAPALVSLYAQQSSPGGRGFTPEALALATAFAYWCLPQIFFYALHSLLSEVLNAREVYGPFTWAPVLNNVVAIAGLAAFMVLFGRANANHLTAGWTPGHIATLAGTATLGVAAQAFVLFLFWKRAGLRFRPEFGWRGAGLAPIGRASVWLFGVILVTQAAGIVQSRVATLGSADGASVAALQNSWLIFILPHSVVAVSIATVYFTRMSGHAGRGDLAAVRDDLSSSLRGIGLIMVFAAVALAVVAYPFARFFETRFSHVAAMGNVILAYLPCLVLFSMLFVIQRVFYSLDDFRTPFLMQCAQSAIFIVGSLACTLLPAQWIGVGLAAVTSIAISTQAVIAIAIVRRRIGSAGWMLVLTRHLQYLALALVAGACGIVVLLTLGGLSADGFAQAGKAQAIASIVAVGAVMALVYGGLLLLLRNPELASVVRVVRGRFRFRRPE
jgi:putative peptidoglycan lipid II flippase